jgi:hypothetical protein
MVALAALLLAISYIAGAGLNETPTTAATRYRSGASSNGRTGPSWDGDRETWLASPTFRDLRARGLSCF